MNTIFQAVLIAHESAATRGKKTPRSAHGTAWTCLPANIFIVDMVFLGDTRNAEELAVFTNMAPERLCCENPTTRHYKYLHKVRSAVLASASNKKKTKTSETSTNVSATLFTPQQGRYMQVKVNLVTCCCHFGSSALLVS